MILQCSNCKREIRLSEEMRILVDPFGFPYSVLCAECKDK